MVDSGICVLSRSNFEKINPAFTEQKYVLTHRAHHFLQRHLIRHEIKSTFGIKKNLDSPEGPLEVVEVLGVGGPTLVKRVNITSNGKIEPRTWKVNMHNTWIVHTGFNLRSPFMTCACVVVTVANPTGCSISGFREGDAVWSWTSIPGSRSRLNLKRNRKCSLWRKISRKKTIGMGIFRQRGAVWQFQLGDLIWRQYSRTIVHCYEYRRQQAIPLSLPVLDQRGSELVLPFHDIDGIDARKDREKLKDGMWSALHSLLYSETA
jgi:hypothetical protein